MPITITIHKPSFSINFQTKKASILQPLSKAKWMEYRNIKALTKVAEDDPFFFLIFLSLHMISYNATCRSYSPTPISTD